MARHRERNDLPRDTGPFPSNNLWRDLLGLGLLGAGSLGIGLLVNGLRAQPLPLVYASPKIRMGVIVARISARSPDLVLGGQTSVPGHWQPIDLDSFQGFVSAHKGMSIDARAPSFYRVGHVPGAINLPREEFEPDYAAVRPLLEPEKERPIVVYCSEADCRDSELVADALSRLGYHHLFVYKEGWEEWSRAGLPQETGKPL